MIDLQLKAGKCYANARHDSTNAESCNDEVMGKDGGVSVLGVGGLRGKGDASQVEPLAPLEKKV